MEYAFDPQLLPASLLELAGTDLEIRPLAAQDHARGHIQLLSVLTDCPDPGPDAYAQQIAFMKSCPKTYFPLVILTKADPSKVVATGQLFLERKFIHGLVVYGHIEDIAVSKDVQGKGLGRKLIAALTALSESLGAYKTILDCSKDNIPFYEKCGFQHKEYEMVKYADR